MNDKEQKLRLKREINRQLKAIKEMERAVADLEYGAERELEMMYNYLNHLENKLSEY